MQKLVIAYAAGRPVDLDTILPHEMMSVPISIANTDGTLRSATNKSILIETLCDGIICPPNFQVPPDSTLVVDAGNVIVSLEKPQSEYCKKFGDFSRLFQRSIFRYGKTFDQIHVVFDRYITLCI